MTLDAVMSIEAAPVGVGAPLLSIDEDAGSDLDGSTGALGPAGAAPNKASKTVLERRNQVVNEIMATERSFVGDLRFVHEAAAARLEARGIIDANTRRTIFMNWGELLVRRLSCAVSVCLSVRPCVS